MGERAVDRWGKLLRHTALRRLDGDTAHTSAATIDGFVDDRGHRRAVDPYFLSALHEVSPPGLVEGAALDARWWWHAAAGDVGVEVPDGGALTTRGETALEVWTETELGALHALWRLARIAGRADWRERALACARWHVRETQPDNATNHPWAIHVFVMVGEDEARMYAEGLLHACQVGLLDRFSALVLLDAARELDRV